MALLRNFYTHTATNPISKYAKAKPLTLIVPANPPNPFLLHNHMSHIANQHNSHLSLIIDEASELILANKGTKVKIKWGNALNSIKNYRRSWEMVGGRGGGQSWRDGHAGGPAYGRCRKADYACW